MATIVVYASASNHGYLGTASNQSFDSAAAGGGLGLTTGSPMKVHSGYNVGGYWEANEAFIEFDLTGVTLGDLQSAKLSLKWTNQGGNTVDVCAYDFGTSVTTADWVVPASLPTALESQVLTAIGYKQGGDIKAGLVSGVNRLMLFDQYLRSTPPETARTATYVGPSMAGTDQDPYFTLTLPGQQLRPDADLATTGWSTAPLWSKVEEASPDGTVISATVA